MATATTPKASQRVSEEKQRLSRQGQQVKAGLTPVKAYLVAYNALSALLWGSILVLTIQAVLNHPSGSVTKLASKSPLAKLFGSRHVPHSLSNLGGWVDRLRGTYDVNGIGGLVKWTQTLAVLEVVHSALGWVRSPVGTTGAQVFSRLWTVWAVVEAEPKTHDNPLFTTMIFAWSLTEVIRYTFYATSVLGITLPGLNWLRYTTFLPLYPLGASSEAFLSFSTLPPLSKLPGLPDGLKAFSPLSTVFKYLPPSVGYSIMKSEWGRTLLWNAASKSAQTKVGIVTEKEWGVLEIARLFFFVTWWPALYVLYTHMLGQRKKVLGKGRTLKSKTA